MDFIIGLRIDRLKNKDQSQAYDNDPNQQGIYKGF